ncbi:hypothetical protein SDC49_02855 [Lactobacillus sp. R2/2]|nr:hypothetical protein [Lactobacillus sp. R2/2]
MAKGYRKIGYVASNHSIPNFAQRRAGFTQALKEKILKFRRNLFLA